MSNDAAPPITFEQSLARLEQIVDRLEEGDLGLSQALDEYEQGVKLLKSCNELLERAERRVELLCAVDAQQQAVTEPFDDSQAALDEKQSTRSRRRTARRPTSTSDAGALAPTDELPGLF